MTLLITREALGQSTNISLTMAFFLTGGTGKTSRHLATFLQDAKLPFVIGSRRGAAAAPSGSEAVKFDWLDESTFKNPFEHKFPHGEKITAVYLVAPEAEEGVVFMNKFIDYSIKEHGVKRFVLLGGSTTQPGGWYVGKVWQHILDVGVDYAVLRPSWFMGKLTLGSNSEMLVLLTRAQRICQSGGA